MDAVKDPEIIGLWNRLRLFEREGRSVALRAVFFRVGLGAVSGEFRGAVSNAPCCET